jgi:DNA-binding transcriptional ArsR family regulator
MAVPLYQAKSELFRTLGHPARIRILELLCERPHAVREFHEHVDIEASNLSQQLSVLRRARMVSSTRRQGEVVYSISVPEVQELLLEARRILGQIAAGDVELYA